MAAMTMAVERSLMPGVMRVQVRRCPQIAAAAHRLAPALPAAFEPPELVAENVELAAEPAASELVDAGNAPARGEVVERTSLNAGIGGNILVGGIYGLVSQVLRPGLRRAARRAGTLAPAVQITGELGAFGIAHAVAGMCKGAAEVLGGVVSRVPLLGGAGAVGAALQMGIASYVGNKVGELLVGVEGEGPAPPVFLANMCVMCNTQFTVGGGQKVAALSCGHACLCADGGADEPGCCGTYLGSARDCPLCRATPVHLLHEIRV